MRRLAMSLAALSLVAAGCGDDSATSADPVRVGQIVSLTGNYSPLGSENKKSVELAVEKVNRDGGVLGRKLEVVVKDDKSQPDQSVLAFNDLRGDDVTAVIGSPFSNSALATIPAVDRAEIPYLSLTPADEQVQPPHRYVFVVPALASLYAERILQYLEATGVSTVAVAHDTRSSYAVAGFNGMKDKASKYGVTIAASEEFQTDATEFGAVFGHVRSSGAKALVVWATGAPAVALTKQYASAGLDLPLVLTGAQASKLFLDPVGPAAEGVTVAGSIGVVGPDLPAGKQKDAIQELTTSFEKKYGYPPPQFAQDGYSGVKLLVAAIEKAGSTDPDKIRDALESLTLVTPNGEYTYGKDDHAGLGPEFIAVTTVTQGRFEPTDWTSEQLAELAG
ncbi:ABC transporter substrate-binding protein [Actinophytocola oryzae]|uniref:Amino acid/amide ABC transporter substrate-binding protein (HAAT family) n=1 Tax=Actinophytocola oryzae TaxID=502181 RepID=A0A4V3FUI3_9PSEU|nr:ABC transporter substrate-binding protein [Actinophytocola oryzae]TDV55381.1 amino acid/amide ABC transporter substrate-binding protein (HAAT family) [Actinophytocola oryzae]